MHTPSLNSGIVLACLLFNEPSHSCVLASPLPVDIKIDKSSFTSTPGPDSAVCSHQTAGPYTQAHRGRLQGSASQTENMFDQSHQRNKRGHYIKGV